MDTCHLNLRRLANIIMIVVIKNEMYDSWRMI
jgi:hypothetical protein